MRNKKILVTGGAGSIGSELVRQLAPDNEVFILDNNETALFDLLEELKNKGFDSVSGRVLDIRDGTSGGYCDYIFHCAALKHVTPSEWSPMEYVKTNIFGTNKAIRHAEACNAKLINISTDKVVNADSVMGSTKRVAELMVKNAGGISVRFGNVLGSRGSVIPIWQKQMDEGLPLTVTHEDMTRYFMTIPEACELVIKAAEIGKPGQTLIMDMGEPVNVLQLAKDILKKSGKSEEIDMIGIRPGETLTEKLMSEDEEKRAVKNGKFYII